MDAFLAAGLVGFTAEVEATEAAEDGRADDDELRLLKPTQQMISSVRTSIQFRDWATSSIGSLSL